MATQSNHNDSREQSRERGTRRLGILHTSAGALLTLCMLFFMVGCDSGTSQNSDPEASYTATPNEDDPTTYTFDASESRDPDGEIVGYEWDYGDGNEDSTGAETVTHNFDVEDSTRFAVALTVIDNEGNMDTEMEAMTVAPPPEPSKIAKGNWELIEFSSQEDSNDKLAKYIIDGDIDTFWHSQFDPERVDHPQYLTVDMKSEYDVTAFEFVHREAGGRDGGTRVKDIELQMSNDGENWETLGEYTLENTRDPQTVKLENSENFRYFKIITKSSHLTFDEGETLATLAEVSALEQP